MYWSRVDLKCYVSVLVFQVYSKVNQLDICPFLFTFFSRIVYYTVLNGFPCAIKQVLVTYIFYTQWCVYVNPNLLTYLSPNCNSYSFVGFLSFLFLTDFEIFSVFGFQHFDFICLGVCVCVCVCVCVVCLVIVIYPVQCYLSLLDPVLALLSVTNF